MRYHWLDYLRGIAALWMIEVHVVDIALDPVWMHAWWFPWLSLTHGFVAVTFLFCAGGAFTITLERKIEAYSRFEQPLWQYLGKLGLLLLIGYWLHLPAFSLERTLHATPAELVRLADCDILQTIAYSSILALTVALTVPIIPVARTIYGLFAVVVAVLTPIVWEQQWYASLPLFAGALIAPQPISKFPLFPFAAYFFAGAWIVPVLRRCSNRWLSVVFITCVGLAVVLAAIGFSSPKQWWHSSPEHVLFRLSSIVAACTVLIRFEHRLERIRASAMLLVAGRQSLWIYVFHLLIVYGLIGGKGLQTLIARQPGPEATALLFLLVAALTLLTAHIWASLKRDMPHVIRVVVIAVVAIGVAVFVVLPSRYAQLLSRDAVVRQDAVAIGEVCSDPRRGLAAPAQASEEQALSHDREMFAVGIRALDQHKFLPSADPKSAQLLYLPCHRHQ
jgi:hypothetical protein